MRYCHSAAAASWQQCLTLELSGLSAQRIESDPNGSGELCLRTSPLLDGSTDRIDQGFWTLNTVNEEIGKFWLIDVLICYQNHSRNGARFSEGIREPPPDRLRERIAHQQNATFSPLDSGKRLVLVESGEDVESRLL